MIRVHNLHKTYGENEVLKGIDLEVNRGEVVAIIGPSGSGKSTLLRCLNLLERPDQGTITISDTEVELVGKLHKKEISALQSKTAMVFQHYNLFRNRSALRNVQDPIVLRKVAAKDEAKTIAQNLLRRVGITAEVENQFPVTLSGGQAQRVSIARALAINPAAILLDEPTSALDPELVGEVLNVISSLAAEHTTMLIVTHEMQFAADVADRVIFMDEGRIVESGPAHEVIHTPKHPRTKQFLRRSFTAPELLGREPQRQVS
ncbi:amino acid ABC transporter ATP-binding protein [Flaviflexus massiliensis]|uniref:amino acid ABC transporter ATP-binding protein n=1 Tax=Flaviflexus massiliensis TaxID=1522309 RepID=UPI0006D56053|nr:amino acid ABC transporter ATP-binding protein [Flaviflexus massiliensis]